MSAQDGTGGLEYLILSGFANAQHTGLRRRTRTRSTPGRQTTQELARWESIGLAPVEQRHNRPGATVCSTLLRLRLQTDRRGCTRRSLL